MPTCGRLSIDGHTAALCSRIQAVEGARRVQRRQLRRGIERSSRLCTRMRQHLHPVLWPQLRRCVVWRWLH